ncbi:sulfatase-like hydrolase/transferase [Nocardia sp. NPDC051750]|uniref:sulfatase-like hydrolase/transferase n=1 Tax=Nocardia sp. NPDC051750 TaxID=3364325 RepID=UPI0037B28E58
MPQHTPPTPDPRAIPDPGRRHLLSLLAAAPLAVPALSTLTAAPAAAAPARRPNILVVMTDQERADIALPSGFSLPARHRIDAAGVRFAMHHTPTAPCTPARSTFFTGLHAPANGMIDNVGGSGFMDRVLEMTGSTNADLDTALPTLGTLLQQAGYHTAYIGKWHLSNPVSPDPAGLASYGFHESHDVLGGGGPNEGLQEDPGVADRAVNWLRDNAARPDPWLCVVSMVNPHDMMFCPRFYRLADVPDHGADVPPNFETDLSTKPRVQSTWRTLNTAVGGVMPGEVTSPEGRRQWQQWGNWYLELMLRTDELIGRVLDGLNSSGAAQETVIVRVSDHGELGGAHGLRQKGAMIYRENNRVPLTIADPRAPETHGTTTAGLTSHIDLVPTLAALAGVPLPSTGRDLTSLLHTPEADVREALLLTSDAKSSGGQTPGARYCLRGTITPRYSFARYSTAEGIDGPRNEFEYELYDRHEDPLEMRNLAHEPTAAPLIDELNDLVDQLITEELAPH